MRDLLLGARTHQRIRIHLIFHVFHWTGWNTDRTEGKCTYSRYIQTMTYCTFSKKKAAFFLGFCGTHGVSSAKPKSKKRTVDRGMGSLWCIKLPMTCFMIGTPLAPRSAKRQQRHAPKFLRMDTPNNSQICRRARYFFQTIIIGIYVPCTGGLGEPFSNKNPQRKVPNHRVELELVKVSWDQMRHPKEDFFEGFRGFRVGGSYDPQGGPLQNK